MVVLGSILGINGCPGEHVIIMDELFSQLHSLLTQCYTSK